MPVAPLTGITVLVTRPAAQASALCECIVKQGGEAIQFPAIDIEPLAVAATQSGFDWIIFISANAVRHGLPHLVRGATRIAAIGKATSAVLAENDVRVDAAPERGVDSESLLAHPAFVDCAGKNILIVKGSGGRDALHDMLTARGAKVSELDVYRRVRPRIDDAQVGELVRRWTDAPIHIVTLTSVEILENLLALLGAAGEALLRATPYVTVSERIAAVARTHGMSGERVLARGANDSAIVGAIAAWHARAR